MSKLPEPKAPNAEVIRKGDRTDSASDGVKKLEKHGSIILKTIQFFTSATEIRCEKRQT